LVPAENKRWRITPLDAIVLVALTAAGAYIAYGIETKVHYRWNWSAIPQYLVRYDTSVGGWVPGLLAQGLLNTIRLSVWTTFIATVIGTLAGLWRVSPSLFQRMVGTSFVGLVRNTPPLVLVFLFYYFLSDQIMPLLNLDELLLRLSAPVQAVVGFIAAPPMRFSGFLSAVITLSVYEGAYIAEIVRAGIGSIHFGQWEASAALGLSRPQQMRYVILPQAAQRILPPMAGQFISTIKDSAIVSVISVQELTFQGMELMAATYLTFEIWITVTALYFVLTFGCSRAAARIEAAIRRSPAWVGR
jgi:polar amino acid transport system permease protein